MSWCEEVTSRSQWRIAAAVLTVLIVPVVAHALDHLRGQIDAERAAPAAAQSQLRAPRGQVAARAQTQPDQFAALPFGRDRSGRLVVGQFARRGDDRFRGGT